MISLKNYIVFITGASAGIGEAAAIEFAKQGAKLILSARRIERVKALAEKLKEEYQTESFVFPLDVRNQKEVENAVNSLPEQWQKIDILVNNAGLSRGLNKLQDGVIQDWEEMIDTNVKGLLYVSRAILPGMVARNKGHIINISSISGHKLYQSGNVYCGTKHAVRAISEGLRLDLFGKKIRVTMISPGAVNTEFSTVRFHGDKSRADDFYKGFDYLVAEDIADAILYAATRPENVNIDDMIIMPTAQVRADMICREGF